MALGHGRGRKIFCINFVIKSLFGFISALKLSFFFLLNGSSAFGEYLDIHIEGTCMPNRKRSLHGTSKADDHIVYPYLSSISEPVHMIT